MGVEVRAQHDHHQRRAMGGSHQVVQKYSPFRFTVAQGVQLFELVDHQEQAVSLDAWTRRGDEPLYVKMQAAFVGLQIVKLLKLNLENLKHD